MSCSCRWNISEKPKVDFGKVMDLKNSELERLSKLYKGNLDSAGVTFIQGRGKVTGPHSVEVNGKEYKVHLSKDLSRMPIQSVCLLAMPRKIVVFLKSLIVSEVMQATY